MGMRVGGSAQAWSTQNSSAAGWHQRQQGVKDLMATLKAGDLAGAQKAFAALESSGKDIPQDSPLGKIGAALKNNDLSAAQNIRTAMRSAKQQPSGAASTASTVSLLKGSVRAVDVCV